MVKITNKRDSQTWLVKADGLASERYRYTIPFAVTFTRKSGIVY